MSETEAKKFLVAHMTKYRGDDASTMIYARMLQQNGYRHDDTVRQIAGQVSRWLNKMARDGEAFKRMATHSGPRHWNFGVPKIGGAS